MACGTGGGGGGGNGVHMSLPLRPPGPGDCPGTPRPNRTPPGAVLRSAGGLWMAVRLLHCSDESNSH